ncbi:3171_t:CDS:2 [Cetraspora pellucida]|uniref:3171_t:CDS:1 n=1 Tax=Cetraspora pellucida TaxID=1433469 RepID=A0A9N9FXB1_9GLOM|nr:3171_t:CDS:2 [Cetraspora pellucida]
MKNFINNEQSDDEFKEFNNKEFDSNQISIYQATSIAKSTGVTEAFENLLVRSASSISTESNIKKKKTEIEVSKEIVAVKKRRTEVEYNEEIFEIDNEIEDYERKQKRLTGKNELTADKYRVIITKALIDIEKYLSYYEKHLTDYSFPVPDYSLVEDAEEYSI